MARKKEERAIRAAHRKERKAQRYLTDGESLASFIIQLNKLGLELREIPGDGNCLFRALGDQLDGHSRSHLNHRQDVARFMAEHRPDFEPFVEDDVPFEQHIRCLRSPGTYAGNDAIVAFARLHQLTVVIHQLNSPLWEIHGASKSVSKQIHISYHNGDHYSSVRRIGDSSESPNNIHFLNGKVIDIADMTAPILPQLSQPSQTSSNRSGLGRRSKPRHPAESKAEPDNSGLVQVDSEGGTDVVSSNEGEGQDDVKGGTLGEEEGLMGRFVGVSEEKRRSLIDNLAIVSGCRDKVLIDDLLLDHGCDFESALMAIRSVMSGGPSLAGSDITSDSDTSSTLSGVSTPIPQTPSTRHAPEGGATDSSGAKPKAKQSKSHRKRERKIEKKAKAEQRHRERVLSEQQQQQGSSLVPGLHSQQQQVEGGRVASSDESDADSLQLTGTVITTTDRLQVLQI